MADANNVAETKKKRSLAKTKFTRYLKGLKQGIDEELSEITIRSRYEKLQSAWNDVQERHDEYMENLENDADFEQLDSWIEAVSNEYFDLEGKVDRHLEELEKAKSVASEEKRRIELEQEEARINDRQATQKAEEQIALSEREKRKRHELFLHREQEGAKFNNFLKLVKNLLASTDESQFKFISEAIKDAKVKLDAAVTCCDEAQRRYISSLDSEETSSHTGWIDNIWKEYGTVSSEAQIFISRFRDEKVIVTEKKGTSSSIKLEKIRFRQFTGDIRQYPKFKADFIKHIQPLCNANEVAFVLRSHLSEEVNHDIENLGDNIEIIWTRLDRKYGDKCKLIDSIMAEIKRMPPCCDNDNAQILRFVHTIEKADSDLRSLGKSEELHNSTIVSMIEEKLSPVIRKEWTKTVTGTRRSEIAEKKFPSLLELLLEVKEQIEYDASELRSSETHEYPAHHTNTQPQSTQKEKDPCWMPHYTLATHPIWKCRFFLSKPSRERVELARENNACFACLQKGHSNKDCPRKFKCNSNNCNLPHHQLLHEAHMEGITLHS